MTTVLVYASIGAVAGILAGLLGLGGGVIIVPALMASLAMQGVRPEVVVHVAVGTSLATIVVTAVSAVHAHHRRGAVRWRLFAALAPSICVGSWVGAEIAGALNGQWLRVVIGSFLALAAAKMLFVLTPSRNRSLPGRVGLTAMGIGIGAPSAVFGIGGGSLTVPLLRWCNVEMRQAVATSAACGLPIAVVGSITNVHNGWAHQALPEYALGYVYLPAFFGIVVASVPASRVGARLAHRLDTRILRRVFAGVLAVVSARLLLGAGGQ